MNKRLFPAFLVASLLLIGGLGASAAAQDSTPAAGDAAAHPAHIHSGTCATLGDVVYPLEDVAGGDMMMGTPEMDHMDMMGTPEMGDMEMMGKVVAESTTIVTTTFDELTGSEHAINVHESAENIQNYIACGDVTGTPTDGVLEIELGEQNGSGYTGHATLTDNGDGTITVWVGLMEGAEATPAA